ncbi:hypothetical protein GCM10008967_21450 [Bacillus carboniphilus]|uniref:Peptidase S11 D-alanyl-D-alanine carboxypeptidase A N-terminal domain-containing protein n=1 Tax=Bacillus carboniphilus TaxID=86663 RepID=A0ABN0WA96_9BACI
MTNKKRYITIFFFFILNISSVNAEQDVIDANAWVVMNSKTGEILLEKNMNQKDFPASITKIVTTLVAIKERDLNEVVTVSQHAANTIGSSLALNPGDQILLKDLLYGIMLHSGNDGAVAVAEHISGSETAFAKKMTAFTKTIGAKNTNFMNASGLPNEQHYTTAYDMAIITQYAMTSDVFREIVGTKSYRWESSLWTKELEIHEKEEAIRYGLSWTGEPLVINHNRLLFLYEGANGVKNGFTHESRYTVVGSAKRDDIEIIAVILRSNNVDTAYQDLTILLDRGFSLALEILQEEQKQDIKDEDQLNLSGRDGSEQKQPGESMTKTDKIEVSNVKEEDTSNTGIQFVFALIGFILLIITVYNIASKRGKGNY